MNGGEWNNVGLKPQKQAPKAENWTALPKKPVQPNPEVSVWGQEIEGMDGSVSCYLAKYEMSSTGHPQHDRKPCWNSTENMLLCRRGRLCYVNIE